MQTTYWSKEKIKETANYLNSVLHKENAKVFKNFEEKGIEFEYAGGKKERESNFRKVWLYYVEKYKKECSPQELQQYNRMWEQLGQYEYCNQIVEAWIIQNHKKEYETFVITNNKFEAIKNKLYFNSDFIREAMFSGNYEKYLTERFGIQNVDEELLKTTDRIAEFIDKQYYGKRGENEYMKYQYAIKQYMITGDKSLLHNILNS